MNYALMLCATLSYQGLLGARRDIASGAGALADADRAVSAGAGLSAAEGERGGATGGAASTPTWNLSTHAADLVADASLFLWRSVCLPMLQQLDEAPAVNPTSRHNAQTSQVGKTGGNGGAIAAGTNAAAGKVGGPNFGSQFAPGSVPIGFGGKSSGKGATSEIVVDALDVNLLVRRYVVDQRCTVLSFSISRLCASGCAGLLSAAPINLACSPVPQTPLLAFPYSSLLAVRAGLVAGAVDDPVLGATVGLRLALVLGDPLLANDTRRAVQVALLFSSICFVFYAVDLSEFTVLCYGSHMFCCVSGALFKNL